MRLEGQHAIVTGGGTGIGAATANALAAEGARVTLIGRRREPLEIAATGSGFFAVADVTDRAQIDRAFGEAREMQGPITILVNNAGAAESAPFGKIDAAGWRRMMGVNLDGVFNCCQAALPDLIEAEMGRIVTIASTAGLIGYRYTAAYVAAKHGAVGLMRALATELASTGVTANAVCPGFTDTGLVDQAVARISDKTGRSAEDARAELASLNPQGRLVSPDEVANAVVWLCLPESRSITGQAIAVAGGEVM
jgi:NAD(P)-dependent dehydrogenase (short-subunit alcohol dehydrogenase family)